MKTSGNTILITGGSDGIGLAMAELFVRAGNEVIICGRRVDKLASAKERLTEIHTRQCDVSKASERVQLIDWMLAHFPNFNVLINNAGIQQMLDFTKPIPEDKIASEIAINLEAPAHLCNLVFPHFRGQSESAILNVTSGLAFVPIAATPVYCSTKAALHSLSITLRHQFRKTSIKVFEIIPPVVDTDLDKGARDLRGQTDKGISSEEVARQTLEAMNTDTLECKIGMAQNLHGAGHSDKIGFVFQQMNTYGIPVFDWMEPRAIVAKE